MLFLLTIPPIGVLEGFSILNVDCEEEEYDERPVLKRTIEEAKTKHDALTAENAKLKQEGEELRAEKRNLLASNAEWTSKCIPLEAPNATLTTENKRLKSAIASLMA